MFEFKIPSVVSKCLIPVARRCGAAAPGRGCPGAFLAKAFKQKSMSGHLDQEKTSGTRFRGASLSVYVMGRFFVVEMIGYQREVNK